LQFLTIDLASLLLCSWYSLASLFADLVADLSSSSYVAKDNWLTLIFRIFLVILFYLFIRHLSELNGDSIASALFIMYCIPSKQSIFDST
jgi:hypothetical protein